MTYLNIINKINKEYGVELNEDDIKKIVFGIQNKMCYFLTNPNDLSNSRIAVIVKYGQNLIKLITYHDGSIVCVLPYNYSQNAGMLNIPDIKKEIELLNKIELKNLSHICAYCNKALKPEEKTIDHIIPKSAKGKNIVDNYVICCSECNTKKANYDINSYLEANDKIAYCFDNYLQMIDNQRKDNFYSKSIKQHIKEHIFSKAKKYQLYRNERINQIQDIEYKIKGSSISFKINKTQAKILDFYLENKDFTEYKLLAKQLKISKSELQTHITHINCLTGIFILKEVSKNGIRLNGLYKDKLEIIKQD